jgi:hypothetical protein
LSVSQPIIAIILTKNEKAFLSFFSGTPPW